MSIENKVLSKDLSKLLVEAGIEIKTLFKYATQAEGSCVKQIDDEWSLVYEDDESASYDLSIPAPLLSELLDKVPNDIRFNLGKNENGYLLRYNTSMALKYYQNPVEYLAELLLLLEEKGLLSTNK